VRGGIVAAEQAKSRASTSSYRYVETAQEFLDGYLLVGESLSPRTRPRTALRMRSPASRTFIRIFSSRSASRNDASVVSFSATQMRPRSQCRPRRFASTITGTEANVARQPAVPAGVV